MFNATRFMMSSTNQGKRAAGEKKRASLALGDKDKLLASERNQRDSVVSDLGGKSFKQHLQDMDKHAMDDADMATIRGLEDVGLTKDEFIGRHRDSVQREMKQSKAEVFGSGLDEIILMNKK